MNERKDISVGRVAFWGGVFIAFIVAGAASLGWVFGGPIRTWMSRLGNAPLAETFASPLLQIDPQDELNRLRAREERILTTFAWTDREHGWVRVPVTKAMEAVVNNGVPASLEIEGGQSEGGKP